jgi:hypothetical protein
MDNIKLFARRSSVVLVTEIKLVDMSGACGTHGRELNTRFEERGHLVD